MLLELARLGRDLVRLPVSVASEIVFDRRMGVRTRGLRFHEDELAPRSVGGDPTRYEAVGLSGWRRVHSAIPIDPGTATFVDLGTGRGRPLILAAEMGFRRVVGVELDGTLVREAEANVRGWRARRGHRQKPGQVVDVVLGDAATYTPPDGPVVMWLFNPFGPVTLRYVLRNVCDTPRSGELFIAYNNAFHRSVFEEFPRLATWAEGKRWAVYRLGPLGQQPSGTA